MAHSTDLKSNIHSLVDQSDNHELLEIVYHLLDSKANQKAGQLLDNLSTDEKKELYEAYDDSLDESKLVTLKAFNDKHNKWLDE
ncbi:MAG: hypothetical protein RIF36_02685 [Imperialibacter sp.]|uniref:hypothetical protein n=1 Tax=Imperialibacter sp. TaxID=2038411 RepID=UPI0032EAA828